MAIFARHPSSQVKTRLAPPLTQKQARALHRACLASTLRLAASLPAAVEKRLFLTRHPSSPGLPRPRSFRLCVQQGRGLGERLRRAFRQLFREGYRSVVVLGCDSPTLPPRRLRQALKALGRADAVLGPARDGGFYLLGLRHGKKNLGPLFRGVDWGTPRAFRQMQARLRRSGYRARRLPLWYDVDTAADLERLRCQAAGSRAARLAPLRAWLARYRTR